MIQAALRVGLRGPAGLREKLDRAPSQRSVARHRVAELVQRRIETAEVVGNPDVDPSIWFVGKSGRPEWVVVRAYAFPQDATERPGNWEDIADGCSHLSTTGHFAPVGICGADQLLDLGDNVKRPYRGHRLHVAFKGLE